MSTDADPQQDTQQDTADRPQPASNPAGRTPARRAPMVFGVALIGLGGTAALASQTGLSLAQSASIFTLLCAVVLLSFLIDRARTESRFRARTARSQIAGSS